MPDTAAAAAPTAEQQTANFQTFEEPAEVEETKEQPAAAEGEAAEGAEGEAAEGAEAGEAEGAEGDEHEDAEGEETERAAAPAAKKKPTAQERINEITRKYHQTDRDLAAEREERRKLEERLAAVEKRGASGDKGGLTDAKRDATDGDAEPKADDFEFGELDSKYIEAKIDYGVKKALKSADAAKAKAAEDEAKQREQQTIAKQASDFQKAGADKFDDFEEVVIEGARRGTWPLTPTLGKLILGNKEVGPSIAYHLASNPEEARAISGKSPIEQAAAFGRLEARFSSASDARTDQQVQPKTPKAPPPPKVARGAGAKTASNPSDDYGFVELKD